MICEEKCLVMDVDGTLCRSENGRYADAKPVAEVVEKLREYRENGFYIILFTSRNMRTHGGNVGRILARTAPVLTAWLERHGIPYDELHFGKPWPGRGGFYVDDCAIRPSEFVSLHYEQILEILDREKAAAHSQCRSGS